MTQTLNRVFNEEKESYLYYNEALLSNNVIIEQSTIETDEGFQTIIDVLHYNDMDAVQYTLYWGNPLSAIQVYRIVKDVHELYIENTLGDFLQLMYEMSEVSLSALAQSNYENRAEIKERITSLFEVVEVHA
ncbi:hypothetical protein [Lysinibacillus fusiformis]|uniref:hypothetical protein n=1 Tax=Lysinibacillus fusiformis TaxID=28031 RepID=UPI00196722A4|nr:hypothetical protein [Lysinibacillus fusiformis]QSB09308.1 hypothetical protein JTI58_20230 [Lysinibacillus fusiformis]UXJ70915.1 hypothetical protein N5069_10365 [Lysinibacillus fusiformis]